MRIHHIGIACQDIDVELRRIERVHSLTHCSGIVYDRSQEAHVCYLEIEGGIPLELISGKKVASFVARGMTYYHLCYEVNDMDVEIDRLRGGGALLVSPPTPAVLFEGRRVAFMYMPYGLVELLEAQE